VCIHASLSSTLCAQPKSRESTMKCMQTLVGVGPTHNITRVVSFLLIMDLLREAQG
jgi:hypothetical protein